jgi:hypothetical protein
VHVFQALPKLAPEAVPAMRQAARFISEAMRSDEAERGSARQVAG